MQAVVQFRTISRLLSYSAKRKALQAAPRFLWQAHTLWRHPHALHQAAVHALKPGFPSASFRELGVVAFYLLARVAVALADVLPAGRYLNHLPNPQDFLKGKLDLLNDMTQTDLLLQRAMDINGQFQSMISNASKALQSAQDSVVRNIK